MGRIEAVFQDLLRRGERALIPFITAGDPDLDTTERVIHVLVEAGADIIELGFPFSDPMADGPTIQASSQRALASGTTLAGIFAMVRRVREHTNTPIVLMGYFNPVLHYGPERFSRDAGEAGVDGLLLVDLPPEEAGELQPFLRQAGIDLITLLAPTTPPERMARLAGQGEGFVYYVSMTGVTGARAVDPTAIARTVSDLRAVSRVPVAVGFGISSPADVAAVGAFADGVVVGSALVKVMAANGSSDRLLTEVESYIRQLKEPLLPGSRDQ